MLRKDCNATRFSCSAPGSVCLSVVWFACPYPGFVSFPGMRRIFNCSLFHFLATAFSSYMHYPPKIMSTRSVNREKPKVCSEQQPHFCPLSGGNSIPQPRMLSIEGELRIYAYAGDIDSAERALSSVATGFSRSRR